MRRDAFPFGEAFQPRRRYALLSVVRAGDLAADRGRGVGIVPKIRRGEDGITEVCR